MAMMIDARAAVVRCHDDGAGFRPPADAMDHAAARRLLLDLRERLDNVTATVISLAQALEGPAGAVSEVASWHFDEMANLEEL